MTVLLVYPTHKNCREVETDYLDRDISAACYPGRTTEDSEDMPQNCWNPLADPAEAMGLPVVKTICPMCEKRSACQQSGYLAELMYVAKADVAICTHKRAEFSGFSDLMKGRVYVSIHENPIDVLRPPVDLSEQDLLLVQLILNRLLNDPQSLDWFADASRVDDEGNKYQDKELAIRKERQYQYCIFLADLVDALMLQLQRAVNTCPWAPISTQKSAEGIERTLFLASHRARVTFAGQPWRFILAAATGTLRTAAIVVGQRFGPGCGQGNPDIVKSVSGFKNNPPNKNCTVWFNDATLDADRLQMIVGDKVNDYTPVGRLETRQKAVQIVRDITRRTSKKSFKNILQGVLADRPQFQRVGVIGHRPHIGVLKTLDTGFGDRVVKASYFGSGDERSSNDWHERCDLIIVAGTPRIPPEAIARYLVQVGEIGAASCQPTWGTLHWEAETESGEPVTVKSQGYQDPLWRRAQRDLVRAQLVQAIGRGRGILETGCEVLVLSNEECGVPISDAELVTLNGSTAQVLQTLQSATMENANNSILAFSIVSTRQIAKTIGLSLVRVRELLRALERRGLVRKVGERSGWLYVSPAEIEATCTA